MELLPPFDLYAELEVPETASTETIEAAWRSLMKRTHPDLVAAGSGERTVRLNVARDWLTDPARRARYDDARARNETAPAATRPFADRRSWNRVAVVAFAALFIIGALRLAIEATASSHPTASTLPPGASGAATAHPSGSRPSPVPAASLSGLPLTFSGTGGRDGIGLVLAGGRYAFAYHVSAPPLSSCGWVLWLADADGIETMVASAHPLSGQAETGTDRASDIARGPASARVQTDCARWSFTMRRVAP